MKSKDDMSFKWAVTRALNMIDKNPERISKSLREQFSQYNWEGVYFPTTLDNIETFERNNNLLVNVFGFDDEEECVRPLRIPKGVHAGRVLLMLIDDHYAVVKCMSRLMFDQDSKRKCKRFYCNNCLASFTSEVKLQSHVTLCDSYSTETERDQSDTLEALEKEQGISFWVGPSFRDGETNYHVVTTLPTSIDLFMRLVKPKVLDRLFVPRARARVTLRCKVRRGSSEVTDIVDLRSERKVPLQYACREMMYDRMLSNINRSFIKHQSDGWVLERVESMDVRVTVG